MSSNTDSDSSCSGHPSSSKTNAPARPRGACVHCKSLKVRCEIIPGEDPCVRCKANDFDCVSRGRKKRRPAPSHEELVQRSLAQDAQIQGLLHKLDEIKTLSKIRYWVSQAQQEANALRGFTSPKVSGWKSSPDHEPISGTRATQGKEVVMSVPRTITPAPSATNPKWPPILRCGLFGPQEVTDLFKLFYNKLHPSFTVLDPALHTPQYLISKSTLLFTKVLCLASRHWTHRPKLHQLASTYTHEAATEAVREGYYTIETCQAFMLATGFPAPRERFAEHRAWLLVGMAIRMSQDLKLNEPPPLALPERLRLDRIRTWFQVVCIDASTSVQQGKPPVVQGSDYVERALTTWYRCSPLNSPYDLYLCAFTDLALLVAKLWKAIGADRCDPDLVRGVDVTAAVLEYHQKLVDKHTIWIAREAERAQDSAPAQPQHGMRLKLIANAMKLIVLGAGFHHSVRKGEEPNRDVLRLTVETALTCIRVHIEELYPAGVLRTMIEPHFLYVTYAAAFLVNLLKKEYSYLLEPAMRTTIVREVRRLIGIYLSKEVALDRAHAPAVHGRFLAVHLDRVVDADEVARTPSLTPEELPLPPDIWDFAEPFDLEEAALGGGADHHVQMFNGGAGGDMFEGAEFCFGQFVSDMSALDDVAYPGALGLGDLLVNPLDERTWWNGSGPPPLVFDQSAFDLATFAMDDSWLQAAVGDGSATI